eukprot:g1105.t1
MGAGASAAAGRDKYAQQSVDYAHLLGERKKELSCIYRICAMHNRFEQSLDSYFREMIDIITQSWQFPNITYVQVLYADKTYHSLNFKSTPWQQSTNLHVGAGVNGKITVGYLKNMPDADGGEGPFLAEERHLLNGVGRIVSDFMTTRNLRQDLTERYKELDCLYQISQVMVKENLNIDTFFRQIVNEIVPNSFQHPNQTAVRLVVHLEPRGSDEASHREGGSCLTYQNQIFKDYEIIRSMKSPIPLPTSSAVEEISSPTTQKRKTVSLTDIKYIGTIEVGLVAGAVRNLHFLQEEQRLIDAIAEQMGACVSKFKRDQLVHSMLPPKVALEIQLGRKVVPEEYDVVSIMFCDIVGFTDISKQCSPSSVCRMLDTLYKRFDKIVMDNKDFLYKVETIGDAYMVVSGLPKRIVEDGTGAWTALAAVNCGLEFIKATDGVYAATEAGGKCDINIRAGVHSGPVVAGVVGELMPRYCLFGDTVNTASRMESNSKVNKVNISNATYALLRKSLDGDKSGKASSTLNNISLQSGIDRWRAHLGEEDVQIIERGKVDVKGKGAMDLFFVYSQQCQ